MKPGDTRELLHRLVESLPNEALEHAQRMLEHMQTWPPKPPPEVQKMREEMKPFGVMRKGIGGGGGSFSLDAEGRIKNGHSSRSWSDGEQQMVETRRFFEGHELRILERFRIGKDGKAVVYSQEISGPKRHVRNEVEFEVDEPRQPTDTRRPAAE